MNPEENRLVAGFILASRELNRIITVIADGGSQTQLNIDVAHAALVRAFEALPAGQRAVVAERFKTLPFGWADETTLSQTICDALPQLADITIRDRSADMDHFVARCTELRDLNGTVLVADGRLTQIEVGDGNFYAKYTDGSTFTWGGRVDGTRIPVSKWTLAVRDPNEILHLIQTHGLLGVGTTWDRVLDVTLLYRLIDEDAITHASIDAIVYGDLPQFELEKADDAAKRADVLSRATNGDTSVWVSNEQVLHKLLPGG